MTWNVKIILNSNIYIQWLQVDFPHILIQVYFMVP